MGALRTVAALVTSLVMTSCVFIIRPDDVEIPDVVPTPLTCIVPEGQPTAHVFFSARIERSTVNLVDAYSNLMTRVVLALAGAGINTTQAVLLRADERPGGAPLLAAWGCGLDSPDNLRPDNVLNWYATQETLREQPLGCVTDPLVNLGEGLADAVTQYPRNLGGTSGRSVFGPAPDIALVVHLDPLPRRSGYAEPACASAQRLTGRDATGAAAWLRYRGEGLPLDRVVHWFVSTAEQTDRQTFVQECRGHSGFPSHLLDLIEPSPKPLYTALAEGLGDQGGAPAADDFCATLADDRAALVRLAADLAGRLGFDVPDAQIEGVLDGGLPDPNLVDGALRPPG